MVATASLRQDLAARGFHNIHDWSRGVDLEQFRAAPEQDHSLPRPVFAYVCRVAVEKNIRAFFDLDLPGSKLVVGGGPQLDTLRRDHRQAHFTGQLHGDALAAYAGADVLAAAEGCVGAVDIDLRQAALDALGADRAACRAHARRFAWGACVEMFLSQSGAARRALTAARS